MRDGYTHGRVLRQHTAAEQVRPVALDGRCSTNREGCLSPRRPPTTRWAYCAVCVRGPTRAQAHISRRGRVPPRRAWAGRIRGLLGLDLSAVAPGDTCGVHRLSSPRSGHRPRGLAARQRSAPHTRPTLSAGPPARPRRWPRGNRAVLSARAGATAPVSPVFGHVRRVRCRAQQRPLAHRVCARGVFAREFASCAGCACSSGDSPLGHRRGVGGRSSLPKSRWQQANYVGRRSPVALLCAAPRPPSTQCLPSAACTGWLKRAQCRCGGANCVRCRSRRAGGDRTC